jgi:hypothetical protein
MADKSIDKPWAVYGFGFGATDIGRLISLSDDEKVGHIRSSEGQYYPIEPWDMGYVKTFKKSIEAISYFLKNQSFLKEMPLSEKDITQRLIQAFPTTLKQEALQTLHDTLVAYKIHEEKLEPFIEELLRETNKEIMGMTFEDYSKIRARLESNIRRVELADQEEQRSQSSPKLTNEKIDLCHGCLRQEKTC